MRTLRSVLSLVAASALLAHVGVAQAHPRALSISAVSNPHPGLVSGGDVLLRVSAPAREIVNGSDMTGAFARQPDGTLLGLVRGLREGPNLVLAWAGRHDGAARLVVVNHSITGPIFSGPQQLPFYCQTTAFGLPPATPPKCSAPTQVS